MERQLETYQKIERSIIKKFRKQLWTPFIVAVKRYELIQAGDKIAVCISGGKDSMLMAKLLQELQRHSEVPFELVYLVMDPGYNEINRQTQEFFKDKISDAIEHETMAFLEKNKLQLRNDNSILADYYKTPNQDYAVRCQYREHNTNIIDLTLSVKNRAQAEAICNNWKNLNEDVYAYLMDMLLK